MRKLLVISVSCFHVVAIFEAVDSHGVLLLFNFSSLMMYPGYIGLSFPSSLVI
jgi:hypothetical protein